MLQPQYLSTLPCAALLNHHGQLTGVEGLLLPPLAVFDLSWLQAPHITQHHVLVVYFHDVTTVAAHIAEETQEKKDLEGQQLPYTFSNYISCSLHYLQCPVLQLSIRIVDGFKCQVRKL